MKANKQERAGRPSTKDKVTCSGSLGGYELSGWRYLEEASWHVKVWPVGRPGGWIDYTVAAGIFELKIVAPAQMEAVLHVIGKRESEARHGVRG